MRHIQELWTKLQYTNMDIEINWCYFLKQKNESIVCLYCVTQAGLMKLMPSFNRLLTTFTLNTSYFTNATHIYECVMHAHVQQRFYGCIPNTINTLTINYIQIILEFTTAWTKYITNVVMYIKITSIRQKKASLHWEKGDKIRIIIL